MRVPFVNLPLQHQPFKKELLDALERILDHGQFIFGPEVDQFEKRFAEYCGVKYAVGVDNGTSALCLSMRALEIGPGDELLAVPNSFLASASSIALTGARPVLVDVGEDYNIDPELLEAAITPRTKAILPVHLTGRPADMRPILEIARRYNLFVIEDCAQAVGAKYHGQRVGSFGDAGCFSMHPLKTLNAIGDAGVVATNNEELAEKLRWARNHGLRTDVFYNCAFWSPNCRLDALQAAFLSAKLCHLDERIAKQREVADFYRQQLQDVVWVPTDQPHEYAIYQTFIIQTDRRDELARYLDERGIETRIHYKTPLHLQPAAEYLGYKPGDFPVTERQCERILSLPIYPELTEEQISFVVEEIERFFA
ncbi:MAG: DegT/DnrJ/EryC1/StrS family aminotransferase [Candidatus Omnitrophota bacterium]